jgi:tRNA 5-methylaminomethyl-2-thiouridine biosynthesis bifunctional protein
VRPLRRQEPVGTHHMPQLLDHARLRWSPSGEPYSIDHDDIYFSAGDGAEESRHIFLSANGLPARWQQQRHFTIGETGFGSGLNLLCCWEMWRNWQQQLGNRHSCRLHYISLELNPFRAGDLQRAHARQAQFRPLVNQLIKQWPSPYSGHHQLEFSSDNLTVSLIYGDARETIDTLHQTVDAWFLDGFAPRHNPQLWEERIFAGIASNSRIGTTLTSFTVAGAVRRGLALAGFQPQRIAGHGRKRQMLFAIHGNKNRISGWPGKRIETG